jgi:hypothetical protein
MRHSIILITVLSIIAVIQVAPQADLPDAVGFGATSVAASKFHPSPTLSPAPVFTAMAGPGAELGKPALRVGLVAPLTMHSLAPGSVLRC